MVVLPEASFSRLELVGGQRWPVDNFNPSAEQADGQEYWDKEAQKVAHAEIQKDYLADIAGGLDRDRVLADHAALCRNDVRGSHVEPHKLDASDANPEELHEAFRFLPLSSRCHDGSAILCARGEQHHTLCVARRGAQHEH